MTEVKRHVEIAGYGEEGIRVRFVTENEVGVLGKIVSLIVEENFEYLSYSQYSA